MGFGGKGIDFRHKRGKKNMNKTEKKLRGFLKKGVICNSKAQKYLEKWFEELKKEEKSESEVRQILSNWTEDLLNERTEILRVVWEDARTLSGTSDYYGLKENGLITAETIGYLVYEDEKRIAICGFLFPDENHSLQDPIQNTAFRDVHMIPKGWIKHIALLKTDWEETKSFKQKNRDWFTSEVEELKKQTTKEEGMK